MTVDELIEKLRGLPGDLEIMIWAASSADQPILKVSLEKSWSLEKGRFGVKDVVFIEGKPQWINSKS